MPRLSYENIQKQIKILQAKAKKLETTRNAQKLKSVAKVKSLMKMLGVEIQDLDGQVRTRTSVAKEKRETKPKISKTSVKVAPRYRHPDTGETWTGRGKTPRWLSALVQEGLSKEAFLIQAENQTSD